MSAQAALRGQPTGAMVPVMPPFAERRFAALHRLVPIALLAAALAAAPAFAQTAERKGTRPAPAPPAATPAPPAAPAAPPPYEPQLLRLSEILGALHHLRTVCGAADGGVWRERMSALIAAEAAAPERRDRLAGAFNGSYRTWARSYRTCTPAADVAVRRFLGEASRIATDVNERYGP